MSSSQQKTLSTDTDFIQQAELDVIVPSSTGLDVEDVLSNGDGFSSEDSRTLLPSIAQRQYLLFDELVGVLVVIRTPTTEEHILKPYLDRLTVNVEAHVVDTAATNPPPDAYPGGPSQQRVPNASPPREQLYAGTISASEEPTVAVLEAGSEDDTRSNSYVIWIKEVQLGRPKHKMQRPAVYFTASATLAPAEKAPQDDADDDYMPELQPSPMNLLEAFRGDPALGGEVPVLSALRITKMSPATANGKEIARPLRNKFRPRLFRAGPALLLRVRYSSVPSTPTDPTVFANIDLEVSRFAKYSVTLTSATVNLSNGQAVDATGNEMILGTAHQPGDLTTLLYRLKDDQAPGLTTQPQSDAKDLEILVHAGVSISDDCHPAIVLRWKAPLVLSAIANSHQPALARPSSSHSTASPATSAGGTAPRLKPGPDSLPFQEHETRLADSHEARDLGISLTITGPRHVYVGESFKWDLYVVNRSDKVRRLALVVLPKQRTEIAIRSKIRSTALTNVGKGEDEEGDNLPEAVVEHGTLYAMQKNAEKEPADLVCLSTDVRIGPLPPAACHSVDLKFMVLAPGVLHIGGIRIVDVTEQKSVDVVDVPDIIALEKTTSS